MTFIRSVFLFLLLVSCILCLCDLAPAALDIFDHPKNIGHRQKEAARDNEPAFLNYPKDCFLKGDYEEALESSKRLLESSSCHKARGDVAYLAGLSLLKLGRFLEARSYFNDILLMKGLKEDLDVNASLGIGDSYLLEGSPDKAYDVYNGLLTKHSMGDTRCALYYRVASALTRMGRSSEAKWYTDTIKKEFPFSFEWRMLDDLVNEANVCEVKSGGRQVYSVQVGCYNQKDNVNQVCKRLARDGFDAHVLDGQAGESPRYRVKVGKFASRYEAKALEVKLKSAGYSTKICP